MLSIIISPKPFIKTFVDHRPPDMYLNSASKGLRPHNWRLLQSKEIMPNHFSLENMKKIFNVVWFWEDVDW